MSRIAFAALAVIAAVGMLARSAAPVAACSCEGVEGQAAVEAADVVFVGWFAGSERPGPWVREGNTYIQRGPTVTTFEVERYLKGGGPPTVELSDYFCDPVGSSDQTVPYLVFGRLKDRSIETSYCFGSFAIYTPGTTKAYEDITGPGSAPDENASVDLRENDPPAAPIVAAGVAIPLVFLLAAAFWPRRPHA